MSIAKKIIKFIKYAFSEPTEEQRKKHLEYIEQRNKELRSTTYNPNTGLPMSGGVDVGGSSFGTSSSSSHRNY